MYADIDYYKDIFGDIDEQSFNRLVWEADRKIDVATTGIDNVRKLDAYFPTDEHSAEAVRRCSCKIVSVLYDIEQAEENAKQVQGYNELENGALVSKLAASVRAGEESISYATGSGQKDTTLGGSLLNNKREQDRVINGIIKEYLSGITDSNGINLLYMGRYPCLALQ